ncbi:MAG: hypothetical protein ABI439_09680 [Rhodospirillales bacterium]
MATLADLDIEQKRRYRTELARTEAMSAAALADYSRTQLSGIAQFAWKHVPYWRKRLAPLFARDDFDVAAWSRVPMLTRAAIMEKFTQLQPDAVPAYAGASADGFTSGSTGAPMRFRNSAIDDVTNAALTERSFDWWRLESGRSMASIQFFPPEWPSLVEGGLLGWRNGEPPGRNLALQLAESPDAQLDWLLRHRPYYLMTRPSQAEVLAEGNLRRGLGLSFGKIMTIGGPVAPNCRALCRQSFGAEIYDSYGSNECGEIAVECPDCRLMHISSEARLVEVVREDLTACRPGQIGRVLVTSYSNYAMPLLRYDLGDFAELGPTEAPCGRPFPSLVRVLGRETETFIRRDGTRFFPFLVARTLQGLMPLKQVQFVQTDYGVVEIRYVPADGNPPIDAEAVQRFVKSCIGDDFSAILVPVADMPRKPGAKYFYHRCEVRLSTPDAGSR